MTGDECRLAGSQVEYGTGEVVDRTEPAGRDHRGVVLAYPGEVQMRPGKFRVHIAGGDRVHRYPAGGPLAGHDPDQLVDASLAGCVGTVIGMCQGAGDRRAVDLAPEAGLDHDAPGSAAQPEGTGEIEFQDAVPVLIRGFEYRHPVVDANGVHQDVQPAEPFLGCCHGILAALCGREVHPFGGRARPKGRQPGVVAVNREHARSG